MISFSMVKGDKGFFQCRNKNWTSDKSCTNDVEYEEPNDTKCTKCGKYYYYKNGEYKTDRVMDLVVNL